jgi:serine protease Do
MPFPQQPPPQQRQPRQRKYQLRGLGSGVIVDAKNGYILTNNHVVAAAETTEVVLADGRKIKSEWVRTDPQTDLAVVKITAEGLVQVPLGDSDAIEVGQWVLAMGSPEGLPQTVTAGIISAKGRYNLGPSVTYQDLIQTDASVNRGNSGGPLVNMLGEVIGLNNMILTSSQFGGNEGISFAIPSNMAKVVMDQLIETGKVVRGYLGVKIQDLTPAQARNMGLPEDTKGAAVAEVVPDSPAAKAGIKAEDIITSVDGMETANVNALRNLVASVEPGKEVDVTVYRDGQEKTLKVKIEEQPKEMGMGQTPFGTKGKGSAIGLEVANFTPALAQQYGYSEDTKGVVITEVQEDSAAAGAGLEPGMTITSVQGQDVRTVEEFTKVLDQVEKGSLVRMRVNDSSGNARLVFLEKE